MKYVYQKIPNLGREGSGNDENRRKNRTLK